MSLLSQYDRFISPQNVAGDMSHETVTLYHTFDFRINRFRSRWYPLVRGGAETVSTVEHVSEDGGLTTRLDGDERGLRYRPSGILDIKTDRRACVMRSEHQTFVELWKDGRVA